MNQTILFGMFNHVQRNTVLDTPGRIEPLYFCIYLNFAGSRVEPVDSHKRGVPDGFKNIVYSHKSLMMNSEYNG